MDLSEIEATGFEVITTVKTHVKTSLFGDETDLRRIAFNIYTGEKGSRGFRTLLYSTLSKRDSLLFGIDRALKSLFFDSQIREIVKVRFEFISAVIAYMGERKRIC